MNKRRFAIMLAVAMAILVMISAGAAGGAADGDIDAATAGDNDAATATAATEADIAATAIDDTEDIAAAAAAAEADNGGIYFYDEKDFGNLFGKKELTPYYEDDDYYKFDFHFDSDVLNYEFTYDDYYDEIYLSYDVSKYAAVDVTVDGAGVAGGVYDGKPEYAITLGNGVPTVVNVAATDFGSVTKTYSITINTKAFEYNANPDRPALMGTFIQPQTSGMSRYTDAQWDTHLDMLERAGIDTIILQWMARTNNAGNVSQVYYESDYATAHGNPSSAANTKYMIERVLRSATKHNMKVFIGSIIEEDGWWNGTFSDPAWRARQAAPGNAMLKEVYDKYKAAFPDAFAGWYWAWEMYTNVLPGDNASWAEMFSANTEWLDTFDEYHMPMLISPFHSQWMGRTPKDAEEQWSDFYLRAHWRDGDIFCAQDSVGAGEGRASLAKANALAKAQKVAADNAPVDIRYWINAENFSEMEEPRYSITPAPVDRFIKQLEIAGKYTDNIITYSYSEFYNGTTSSQMAYDAAYRDYAAMTIAAKRVGAANFGAVEQSAANTEAALKAIALEAAAKLCENGVAAEVVTVGFTAAGGGRDGLYTFRVKLTRAGEADILSDAKTISITASLSSDATLRALSIGAAGNLSPAFDSAVTQYAVAVPQAAASVTVTATRNDTNAKPVVITASGTGARVSGSNVTLASDGPTVITVRVTAEDGVTTMSYVIVVTKNSIYFYDEKDFGNLFGQKELTPSYGVNDYYKFDFIFDKDVTSYEFLYDDYYDEIYLSYDKSKYDSVSVLVNGAEVPEGVYNGKPEFAVALGNGAPTVVEITAVDKSGGAVVYTVTVNTEEFEYNQDPNRPSLLGTFVQPFAEAGNMCYYTEGDWDAHLDMLKRAGIDTVIVQWMARTDRNGNVIQVFYESDYAAAHGNPASAAGTKYMLENLLKSATKHNMKVLVGSIIDEDSWWSNRFTNAAWRVTQADVGNAMLKEVYDKYKGAYPDAFAGWYWAWEMYTYVLPGANAAWAEMFSANTEWLDTFDEYHMPMLISPFHSTYRGRTPKEAEAQWEDFFSRAHWRDGDIFCAQDSVGAGSGRASLAKDNALLKAMKVAVDRAPVDIQYWVNCENFAEEDVEPDYPTDPASMERFAKQLEIAWKYTSSIITYSYSEFYDGNGDEVQRQCDADYRDYAALSIACKRIGWAEFADVVEVDFKTAAALEAAALELVAPLTDYGVEAEIVGVGFIDPVDGGEGGDDGDDADGADGAYVFMVRLSRAGEPDIVTVEKTVKFKVKPPVLVSAAPSAAVAKLNGNKNDLTVTVTELYSDGSVVETTKTFSIDNNAAAYYTVGAYTVYVDTKGNTKINACYIV